MGKLDPQAAGEALQQVMVAQLTALGIKIPDRQALLPGAETPWDGEELYFNWLGIPVGNPQSPDHPQGGYLMASELLFYYEFRVTLLRDVSALTGRGKQGGLPSKTDMTANFVTLAEDATAITEALVNIQADQLLVRYKVPFWFGPIASVGPTGKLAGTVCPISFSAGMSHVGDF